MTEVIDEVKEREKLIKSMTDKYDELGREGFFISKMMDSESKTGRNNRCHCGSGRKYKMCCKFLYEEKRDRYIELSASMHGIAIDIMEQNQEIKDIKQELADEQKDV